MVKLRPGPFSIDHRVIKNSHILVKVSVSCCSEAVYLTEKLLTDVKLVWYLTDVYIYYFIYYIILFILYVLYVTVYIVFSSSTVYTSI